MTLNRSFVYIFVHCTCAVNVTGDVFNHSVSNRSLSPGACSGLTFVWQNIRIVASWQGFICYFGTIDCIVLHDTVGVSIERIGTVTPLSG